MDDRVRVPDLGSKWDIENQKHIDYVSRAYTDLLRVARAAKEWAEYCPPRSRTKREQAIHDALKEVEDLL